MPRVSGVAILGEFPSRTPTARKVEVVFCKFAVRELVDVQTYTYLLQTCRKLPTVHALMAEFLLEVHSLPQFFTAFHIVQNYFPAKRPGAPSTSGRHVDVGVVATLPP